MTFEIYIVLCLFICIMDALRDAWLNVREVDVNWFQWHLVKWLSFYPQFIVYTHLFWQKYFYISVYKTLLFILLTILISWFCWKEFYNAYNKD